MCRDSRVISDDLTFYDGSTTLGTAPTKGDVTTTKRAVGTPHCGAYSVVAVHPALLVTTDFVASPYVSAYVVDVAYSVGDEAVSASFTTSGRAKSSYVVTLVVS
jgi:hypothetical protein